MPPVTIGRGNLYFRGLNLGVVTPKEVMEAPYTATAKIDGDIYEHFVNSVLFDMRVTWIVGYNPQKLLPAPSFEREFMQNVAEWAHEQIRLPYTEFANSVLRDSVIGDEFIHFDRKSDPSSAAYFLADKMTRIIKAMTPKEAPTLVIGSDFTDVEMRMLSYMHATFVHESAGGSPTPRGRIEIFDYEDGTVINLEGAGELPGLIDESFWQDRQGRRYSPLQMKPTVQPIRRQPTYLDHDPTKKHKRRKQRGNPHKR